MTIKKQPKTLKGWMTELERVRDTDEERSVGQAFAKWYEQNPSKYTIEVSLLNEQTGNKEWGGKTVTFYNEDNAISHLGLLESFFELLLENKDWGYEWTSEEVLNKILNPIKARLEGKKVKEEN